MQMCLMSRLKLLCITLVLCGNAIAERPDYFKNYYYPGTEQLGKDEMRVTALGTGLPIIRKSQASSSWLVELGNGDVFLFDVGFNTVANLAALQISYRKANKLFISHLHADHVGDFDALLIAGWLGGRFDRPLEVWGAAGSRDDLGAAHFVANQIEAWRWDITAREAVIPVAGSRVEMHEFDGTKKQVIYERNGVRVISFPAYHKMLGSVSYRLEWNGLVLVYSGDTAPNTMFVENGKNADLLIHETMQPADELVNKLGWDRDTANYVSNHIHTSPANAGRIFTMTGPRMAVATHFLKDFDTGIKVASEIRTTYSGPLTVAEDLMVFNVTADDIKVRLAKVPETVWPERVPQEEFRKAERGRKLPPLPDWLEETRILFPENTGQ